MGESDVYCAFCAGPVGAYFTYGSTKPEALEKRRRRLEDSDYGSEEEEEEEEEVKDEDVKSKDEEGGGDVEMGEVNEDSGGDGEEEGKEEEEEDEGVEVVDDEEEEEEDDSDGEEAVDGEEVEEDVDEEGDNGPENNDPVWQPHSSANDDKPDSFDEKHSYNYNVLKEDELRWTNFGRCLAFNPRATGLSRTFISDRGTTDGFGYFNAESGDGEDENNDEEASEWPCYYAFQPDEYVCFPFHEKCYSLFARCMVGEDNEGEIDKDALYVAMKQNAGGQYCDTLFVDYGGINGPEQFWDCVPGEEYSVADPGPKENLDEDLQKLWANRTSFGTATGIARDLTSKVKQDPFGRLPYDVISMILPRVALEDVPSLMKASYYLHSFLHNDAWKALIRSKILPWFWEAESFVKGVTSSNDISSRSVFFWLEKITRPFVGMKGPLIGIANRRRIWHVCEELGDLYWSFVPEKRISNEIMDRASFSPLLALTHPPPISLGKHLISQWLLSWDDFDKRAGEFVTYWRPLANSTKPGAGSLVDLGVKFGDEERVLNHQPRKFETMVKTVPFEEGDWIEEIVFHIQEYYITVSKNGQSCISHRESTYIQGVTVRMKSGLEHNVSAGESIPPGLNKRVCKANPGHELIGLSAEVAKNGRLSAIAAIHSPRFVSDDDDDDDNASSSTLDLNIRPDTLLWGPNSDIPYPDPATSSLETVPVWRHPSLAIQPFTSENNQSDVPARMAAHHMLLWAHSPAAYRNLRSISACSVDVGISKEDGLIPDIIGFRADYVENGTPQHREIGSGGPVPAMTDRAWTDTWQQTEVSRDIPLNPNPRPGPWDPFHRKVFEIDGDKGEMVTEVVVARDTKAIKIRTNKDRECRWGEQCDDWNWPAHTAEEGRVIVGIVAFFVTASSINYEDKEVEGLYGHLKLSSLSVVTMPVDVEGV